MVIVEKKEILQVNIGKNWVVEITDALQRTKEFWLCHKQYCIKTMMFGIKAEETELINELIENMIEVSKEYRKQYIAEFIDDIEI